MFSYYFQEGPPPFSINEAREALQALTLRHHAKSLTPPSDTTGTTQARDLQREAPMWEVMFAYPVLKGIGALLVFPSSNPEYCLLWPNTTPNSAMVRVVFDRTPTNDAERHEQLGKALQLLGDPETH